ncbi:5-methylaminomethyl-2-thiouridine-forming enzyme mnmC [Klebsiella michiganensis]|uniref:5-methylaminomethyl-2-thiouridine-forming enzyme mnmC n=1 Tax=Klebsiella michiganensis TaxID=1134687 RepID=A0A7H4PP05_9ENTR|nr:5-methylaminomethyl-2-thiouridine-forming enzyme mnmC [Klebsiella michiganensis]
MKQNAIQPANLEFNAEGTPVSRDFDDVYFSNDNGLEETRYVFLDGNQLKERFPEHARPFFVVAESGFGTGLNFLTLWQAFDVFHRDNPEATLQRLHFISFEKFPLKAEDLRLAHQRWPELATWAEQLQAQWPLPIAGCHRLLLDEGRVTLDLWFGDINELTNELDDSLNQQVDAWFLDGFAPAKNPGHVDGGAVCGDGSSGKTGGTPGHLHLRRLCAPRPAGGRFSMQKRKGFGRKREMLTGEMRETRRSPRARRGLPAAVRNSADAAIIGGGIASALLALALLRRGWQVTLYCADSAPAAGASGNRQGALYPLLSQHDPALARFFPAAFTFARRVYDALPVMFDHDWCGVTQLGWDTKSAQKIAQMIALNLPPEIAVAVDARTTAQQTGVETGCGGIAYPAGGWLCPQQLTAELLALAATRGLRVRYDYPVTDLSADNNGWQLNQRQYHEVVVLANGHQLTRFSQTEHLPMYPVAGQVSHIPTTPGLSKLRQVLVLQRLPDAAKPA